jgi:hypothetical protein
MTPGDDCISCHSRFTFAGTVYAREDALPGDGVADVQVILTDAASRSITLTSNAAGNFYTEEPLQFPVSIELRRGQSSRRMSYPVTTGACSSCHTWPAPNQTVPGRLFVAP